VTSQAILGYGLQWALRVTLMAGVTGAVLAILRVRQARIRHFAWSAVVLLSLLVPLGRRFMPVVPLRFSAPEAAVRTIRVARSFGVGAPLAEAVSPIEARARRVPAQRGHLTLAALAPWCAGLYCLVAGVLVLRLMLGTFLTFRLVRESTPCDGRMVSARCAAPITVGWLRPVVLLPADWREWSSSQLNAVLSHEAEHARWRDPLTQWIAALNCAIFWFHPLVWWLERSLNQLAEEACDQAALAHGADPVAYAGWLLQFARSVSAAGERTPFAGMTMACSLVTRLTRLTSGMCIGRTVESRAVFAMAICPLIVCAAVSTASVALVVDSTPASPAILRHVLESAVDTAAAASLPAVAAPRTKWRKGEAPSTPLTASAGIPASASQPAEAGTEEANIVPASPGDLVIYIDSASLKGLARQRLVEGAEATIPLVVKSGVRAAVMVYRGNGSVALAQDFTANQDLLIRAMRDVEDEPEPDTSDNGSLRAIEEVADRLTPRPANRKKIQWLVDRSVIADVARHDEWHTVQADLANRGVQLSALVVP